MHRSWIWALAQVALGGGLIACDGAPASGCRVAADCEVNAVCVDGACVASVVVPVEGEGEAAEGEGEKAEGEGEEGEGEEGEGEEGEGEEGEGEEGEGEEGEGEAPCVGVTCREFQQCEPSTEACEYTGDICDAFQGFNLPAFSSSSVALSEASGSNFYDHFNAARTAGDYLLDAWQLDLASIATVVNLIGADTSDPPAVKLRVDVNAVDFDPFIGVIDNGGGQCLLRAENDDFPAGNARNSRVELPVTALGSTTNHVVVSSFLAETSGSYDIRVRPLLCGEEVDSTLTFNQCGRALSTTANNCVDNNPCERDTAGNLTGRACCISTSLATATTANNCGRRTGETITTFESPSCN